MNQSSINFMFIILVIIVTLAFFLPALLPQSQNAAPQKTEPLLTQSQILSLLETLKKK